MVDGALGDEALTPEKARQLLELLDLIDEAHPSAGDALVLKSVLRRLIPELVPAMVLKIIRPIEFAGGTIITVPTDPST